MSRAAVILTALDDPSAILDHLNRLADTVDSDPRLAVSTAKALIESTAMCVLSTRGLAYSSTARLPALVNEAQTALSLAPKGSVPKDVDHGAESVPTWVRPRHARLVVGSAQVWCGLMPETLADPEAPWRKAPK